jgi:hypothetical protein
MAYGQFESDKIRQSEEIGSLTFQILVVIP